MSIGTENTSDPREKVLQVPVAFRVFLGQRGHLQEKYDHSRDRCLERGRVDRSANTTPGNKAGGLSNIVEKAMGSIVKSAYSAIGHVSPPGEKLRPGQRGLVFAATPASDFICGTLQLAAGMNLHVFTTGRGTHYGLAAWPPARW